MLFALMIEKNLYLSNSKSCMRKEVWLLYMKYYTYIKKTVLQKEDDK